MWICRSGRRDVHTVTLAEAGKARKNGVGPVASYSITTREPPPTQIPMLGGDRHGDRVADGSGLGSTHDGPLTVLGRTATPQPITGRDRITKNETEDDSVHSRDARQAKSDLRTDSERDGATASEWASASGMPRARAQQPHGRRPSIRPSHPDVTDSPYGLVGSQKYNECVKNVWATKVLLQYHGCIPGLVIYRARASSPPLVPPPHAGDAPPP